MQNISGQIIGRYANNQPSGFLQKHASMPFREEVYEVQGSIRARWVTLSGVGILGKIKIKPLMTSTQKAKKN